MSSVFNSAIYKCFIDATTGDLSNCGMSYQNTTTLPSPIEAVIVKDSSTLLVNTNLGVSECTIASDGNISTCSLQAGFTYPAAQNVRGLEMSQDKSKLYIIGTNPTSTDLGSSILQCDNTSPITNCISAWSDPQNPAIPNEINPAPNNTDSSETGLWKSGMVFTSYNYTFVSTATYSWPGGVLLRTSELYACEVNSSGLLTNCIAQLNPVLNANTSINRMAIIN